MITNGQDIDNGKIISTQVCIIGSGQAGITAAWLLQKAGLNVTLIDGGGNFGSNYQASWPEKTWLYNGVADGLFTNNEPKFLIQPFSGQSSPAWERERVFGGTSAHWGGQSRPLDPIDFEKRPGFPGWPITRADLDPYYAQAAAFCKLHGDNFSAEYWANLLGDEVPDLEGFNTDIYQFIGSNYLNFATRTFDGITIGESAANVIVNANLLNIDHDGGVVRSLTVASTKPSADPTKIPPTPDTQFTIKADVYVMACGAVANARQLLLSNAGNESDQVGRYFMGHPIAAYAGIVNFGGGRFLSDAELRLMNGDTLSGSRPVQWRDENGVTVTGRFSPTAEKQRELGIGSCWFWANYSQYYFELAPNPDSRVTLDDSVDPVFGQKQTRITWLLNDVDRNTYTQTTQMFAAAVSARGGSVSFASWDYLKSQLVVNGHHIGTTRMSADPKDGVVDKNLKVHTLDNLYVAGSSVYASAGISNPTFTIIALSIRLAEHLIAKLKK